MIHLPLAGLADDQVTACLTTVLRGDVVISRVITVTTVMALLCGTCADAIGQQVLDGNPPLAESEGAEPDFLTPGIAHAGLNLPGPASPDWFSTPLRQESQSTPSAPPPPEPEHTGISALIRTTAADFAAFPRRQSTWVILGIGGAAAASAYPFDDEANEYLQDAEQLRKFFIPGKYIGYGWVQAGAATGVYLIGRYAMAPGPDGRTNKVSHLGFDLLRASLVTQSLTLATKYIVRRDRPTGECCAFPSGHASVTFATAAVLERHFGYRASWPMFAVAGYVSMSRLTDNRHFVSDVLFGSALGMASGWTVVGRHGRQTFTAFPVPVKGGLAMSGEWRPGGSGAQ